MILTLSLLIRVTALGWCVRTLRRVRSWQLSVVAIVLGLMVAQQALAVAGRLGSGVAGSRWQALLAVDGWRDPLDLAISVLALVGVVVAGRMLRRDRDALTALRERDLQFAHASRIAELGTFEIDLDRLRVTCSVELARMLAIRHDAGGQPLAVLTAQLHPDDASRFEALCRAMARGDERAGSMLLRMPQPDGVVRRLHARGELVPADGRHAGRMVGVVVDVTEEAAIREQLEALAEGQNGRDADRDVPEWLVLRLAEALGTDYAFLSEFVDDGRVRTVAVCSRGELVDNFDYVVAGTPCGVVSARGLCVIPTGVQRSYPDFELFGQLAVDGYAAARLEDANGEPVGVLGVMHRGPIRHTRTLDTLLHVYALRATNELERLRDVEKLRMTRYAMDHAGDSIFLVDRDARVVDANDTACRRLGISLAQLQTMFVWDIDEVFSRDRWDRLWHDLGERRVVRFESRYRDGSGRDVPIELVLSCVSFRGGDHLCAMARDISARVEQNRELAFRQFLVDHGGDALFTITADGSFLDVNETACRRLGYERDELLRLKAWDVDRSMCAELWPRLWRRNKGCGIVTVEGEHVTRYGRVFPVEVVGRYVEYHGQECIVAFARDVTERRHAEARRVELEEELRHIQKMEAVGTLAGGIAHDFNNLLTTVLGNVDLALLDLDDHEAVRESFEAIENAAHQGSAMTQSLLMFAHKSRAEMRAVDLSRLITETTRMIRRLLPAAIELVETMPAVPLWVVGDAAQLQQVLMNLAVNAQHAMPDGGTLRIELRDGAADGAGGDGTGDDAAGADGGEDGADPPSATLVVADTGCGMDEETRSRVFEPFFTTRSRGQGTGLGLAIVHGIVHEHGGSIRIASEVGVGTRIELQLPLAMGEDSAEKKVVLPALAPVRDASVARGAAVLVAEDNAFVRRMFASTLKSIGCRAEVCEHGEQALQLFREDPARFRLAVLDIDMPRLSGLECLDGMRQLRPDLPVLMVSGNAGMLVDAEARSDVIVLAKPFRMGDLVQQVSVLLEPPVGT